MHRNEQRYEIFGNKTNRNWHTTIISFAFALNHRHKRTIAYSYARIIRFGMVSAQKWEPLVSALYFYVYEIQYPYNGDELYTKA